MQGGLLPSLPSRWKLLFVDVVVIVVVDVSDTITDIQSCHMNVVVVAVIVGCTSRVRIFPYDVKDFDCPFWLVAKVKNLLPIFYIQLFLREANTYKLVYFNLPVRFKGKGDGVRERKVGKKAQRVCEKERERDTLILRHRSIESKRVRIFV